MNPIAPSPVAFVNLADYEARAREVLPPAHWAFLDGHAANGSTHRHNSAAWDALKLLPRPLKALAGGHTRQTLLGRPCAHPILLAPVALHALAHPDAEFGVACAAAAQQAGMVLSTQASTDLETVAQAFRQADDRGPLWMQLYLQPDRGFTHALVQRAEQAGFEALVLTVDAPVHGVRDGERRTGFQPPEGISAVNLAGMQRPPTKALQPHESPLFDALLYHAPTWDDLVWLQQHTRLPIVLKGILHPDDAVRAQALGAAGVIVSNHGGRTLDTAVSTAWALPRVVDAVGPDWPVLVDGGIRRGTDVLKALALGAHAVLIGRPYIHGLAAAGAQGVAHVIRLLRDELEIAMALTGCRTLADIQRDLLIGTPQA